MRAAKRSAAKKKAVPGWTKAVPAAAALRSKQSLERASASPELMGSYLAAFLTQASEEDHYAKALRHLSEGTGKVMDYGRVANYRGGYPMLPSMVRSLLPIAAPWVFSQLGLKLSLRDTSWIADRIVPSILAEGVMLPQLLQAALVERQGQCSLSAVELRWAVRALLPAAAHESLQ